MIGLPRVERRVDRGLVVEITVASVDRQQGRWNRHQNRARAALDDLMPFARDDQDHLMPESRRGPKLGFRIGADAATDRRVEG